MLYLIRHADAVDGADDAERSLSRLGRERAGRLAAFLRGRDLEPPEEIWHSPLVRARETAEIVARGLDWKAGLAAVAGLQPDDPPGRIAARLADVRGSIAIFGHNPHLSLLSSVLVTGRTVPAVFVFEKCSALAIEACGDGRPGGWIVHWHIDPHLLG